MGDETSEQIETDEESKKIAPYCNPKKALISGKLKTMGHRPREVSSYVLFFIAEEGERVDGSVLSHYLPAPRPNGGLEIPFMLAFRSLRYNTHQKMKDFITKLYCYDHE